MGRFQGWASYGTGEEIRCPAYDKDRRRSSRDYTPERRSVARRCGYPDGRVGPGTVIYVRVHDPAPISWPCQIRSCRECQAVLQVVQVPGESKAAAA